MKTTGAMTDERLEELTNAHPRIANCGLEIIVLAFALAACQSQPRSGRSHDLVCFTPAAYRSPVGHIVMQTTEDGRLYSVGPDETLGDAMTRQEEGEADEGNCYPKGYDGPKPDETVTECVCWETTKCEPGRGEVKTCERYCRKHKCDCCSI